MIAFTAVIHRRRSFSHWGEFDLWREPVEIRARDMGIVSSPLGEHYVTEFDVSGQKCISRISADDDLNAVLDRRTALTLCQRRIIADMAALAEMGVDEDSIDFGTIRNI